MYGESTLIAERLVEHRVLDEKGRHVGSHIAIFQRQENGITQLYVAVTATRDGKHFGAHQPARRVGSIEFAWAVGEKKAADSGKRMRRKFATEAGDSKLLP